MSDRRFDIVETTASLKRAFDSAFASPPAACRPDHVSLIAIRVAGAPYALRTSEITALAADRKLVPVPGATSSLRGLAGFHGRVIAVYSLASLLGQAEHSDPENWLVRCAADPSLGLSFESFEGYIGLDKSSLHQLPLGERTNKHCHEFFRAASSVRAVLDLASLLATIQSQLKPLTNT
jgi:chemotaxis signal transduction protein